MIDNPDLSGFEPVKATRRTRTKWTTGMIEQLKTLNAEGLSDLEIADRLGVDVQAVKNKSVLSGIKKPEAQKPVPNPNPDYRPPLKKEYEPPKATIIPERPTKDYTHPMTAALVNILTGAPSGVRVLIDGKPVEKIIARVEYDLEGKENQRDIVLMSEDFRKEISDAEV